MDMICTTEDADGVSRFEERAIALTPGDFAPPAPSMPISASEPVSALLHLVLPAGWTGARHPTPRRQMGYLLKGRVRVETGDGESREFGAGAIWRMEDTAGSGHRTTVLGDEDVHMAIVQF
ncbi:cupin domain-containing protein [Albimonas sp. CAU 1670]|uniref:cupin domain-containing protein n=1 Tax=Albimonas sp. CAU 1670 TaxID=3032599 RepID=UPI0023DB7D2C|nr:cupin domain-containing protein [Albimonas sp. CAU 1670]MDF2231075.1 cupin domain-containing protein [Albimonas sp. CAU 1670]